MTKNLLIVLSGPSGVGKGTIINELLKKDDYTLSISCTTRSPREGEIDGESYFFITREKFLEKISSGGFLEYSEHFDNLYGTPKAFVEEKLKTHSVILEIEVDGALNVKKAYPDALLIMILPPDIDELKKRLVTRGTETPEKIEKRLKRFEYELNKKDLYDYVVINDDLKEAIDRIESIIEREKEI